MTKLTQLPEWQVLTQHAETLATAQMRAWFQQDPQRATHFSLQVDEIWLDYSRNRITTDTLAALCALAKAVGLSQKREALFTGQAVNTTENRPALHTALRDPTLTPLLIQGEDSRPGIANCLQQMHAFVEQIHSGAWTGATGKPIQHIVNIGIGGSYLGPMMTTQALVDYAVSSLRFYFVSSIDKTQLDDALKQIDPETTLFIVSSKSFSTLETLTNARSALAWLQHQLPAHAAWQTHFIAVTAKPEKAQAFGLPDEHIFPLWDWVGGRYSVWSAIGLPLALMIGNKQFMEFLQGAHHMDTHFREAPFAQNMPILLGLLDIWYTNFFGAKAQAIIPYSYRLRSLPGYFQQAEMESNGKRVALNGDPLDYGTSPVLFGEEGCNGQHAFYQLLHQGQQLIPVHFILMGKNHAEQPDLHHDILMASGLSQAEALMRGKEYDEIHQAFNTTFTPAEKSFLAHHQTIPGNKPCTILFLHKLSPKNLGALLALYEHKIFVQGAIWDINSFDQWGVELGKQLLPPILQRLQGHAAPDKNTSLDSLITRYRGDTTESMT
jgi:glucose-6-phosphate isomerase